MSRFSSEGHKSQVSDCMPSDVDHSTAVSTAVLQVHLRLNQSLEELPESELELLHDEDELLLEPLSPPHESLRELLQGE